MTRPVSSLIICFVIALALAAPGGAQTFYSNVPDFYQHQKVGPTDNGIEDPAWENGGGWCFWVSTINQFFFFKKKDPLYKGLLPDDVTAGPPKWLPASSAAIQQFVADIAGGSALQTKCQEGTDPRLKDWLTCILDDRGAGPKLGVGKGLIHATLRQGDEKGNNLADVYYYSAEDGWLRFKANTNLFAVMQKLLTDGDSVNLFLGHTPSDKLWWSHCEKSPAGCTTPWKDAWERGYYHSVTVAGVDATAGKEKVWFADPDSNPDHNYASKLLTGVAWLPGNKNKNSGFTPLDGIANCGANGDMYTNQQCIRLRRFVGNEPLPMPVNNPPTQKEIDQRYFQAAMSADLKGFNVKNADFDRYDSTDLVGLNVVGKVDSSPLKPGKLAAGALQGFEVGPGADGATPIDEFWVFPASYDEQITMVSNLPPGWVYETGSSLDPWGNDRPYGWIHVYTPQGPGYNPLIDTDVLDLSYGTVSGNPLNAWDIFVRYQGDDSTLGVQAFGANPPLPPDQTPDQD